MAAPHPVAERIQYLREALRTVEPAPPSDWLISPDPFRLDPRTIDELRRLGPVLSRFQRTATLIGRRSILGSLPAWISAMVHHEASPAAKGELPSILCPSLRLTKKGLALADMGWRTDQVALAGQLQQALHEMGEEVIGGSRGILDGLASVTANESRALPQSLDTSLWLALLWSAPLESVWARELRSSNLRFLRDLVPISWAVDPAPLPIKPSCHGSEWSFADLVDPVPGIADLVLKPAAASLRGQGEVIRSLATDSEWATALRQAMDDFSRSPWLLQEHHQGQAVEHRCWNPAVNSIQPISGEVTLTPYYFDTANQTMLGGILATIQSSTAVPRCSEGETGEILSVLAPCVADTAN